MSGPLWTVLLKYARIRKEVDVVVGLGGGGEKLKAEWLPVSVNSIKAEGKIPPREIWTILGEMGCKWWWWWWGFPRCSASSVNVPESP